MFDALAEVAGAADTGPAGLDSTAGERLWEEFERQFADYVESGAGGSGTPRPGERAG